MPTTPQITLTVTLEDIFGAAVANSLSLTIQLAGFGSQVPRIAGTAMVAVTAPLPIETDASGKFSKTIFGNDAITPAGTYYVLQVLDQQGNVIQANAYQLTGSGSVDVSTLTPYLPSGTPVILPGPAIIGALAIYPWAAIIAMSATGVTAFKVVMTGNTTSTTLSNLNPGTVYTFILIQDATGGRTWAWPTNVLNAETIGPLPNQISVQSFICDDAGNLRPIGPMTLN